MANRNQYAYDYDAYMYGTSAPLYDPYEDWEAGPEERNQRGNRKQNPSQRSNAGRNSSKARRQAKERAFHPAMIGILLAVTCGISMILIQYISLQSSVTSAVKEIASLETQLADLKSDNDEKLNEINSNISLDDIKYRAIAELGMTYAQEDQIVTYDGESDDYVRQVTKLGE